MNRARVNWIGHGVLLGVLAVTLVGWWLKVLLMPRGGVGEQIGAGLGAGIMVLASVAFVVYAALTSGAVLALSSLRGGVVLAHVSVLATAGLVDLLWTRGVHAPAGQAPTKLPCLEVKSLRLYEEKPRRIDVELTNASCPSLTVSQVAMESSGMTGRFQQSRTADRELLARATITVSLEEAPDHWAKVPRAARNESSLNRPRAVSNGRQPLRPRMMNAQNERCASGLGCTTADDCESGFCEGVTTCKPRLGGTLCTP